MRAQENPPIYIKGFDKPVKSGDLRTATAKNDYASALHVARLMKR